MPENNSLTAIYGLLGIVAAIVLIGLLVALVHFFIGFSQELRHINTEIGRTQGEERKHWERRKRKLWLSLIPFVKY